MSDQDNAFSGSPSVEASPADLLATIKNEAGEPKYKTVEDALKALANSQAFIPQLLGEKRAVEEELQTLREKASKIDSIEEVVKKLTENAQVKPEEKTPPQVGLDAGTVEELVKKQLEKAQIAAQAKKNFDEVNSALKNKFGEKMKDEVAKKATELGTTPEKLGELAATSPAMVLALFQTPKSTVSPTPAGSVRIPPVVKPSSVPAPQKSVLLGATGREQREHMLEHKRAVYEKYGIQA